jgi:hypothetical protein
MTDTAVETIGYVLLCVAGVCSITGAIGSTISAKRRRARAIEKASVNPTSRPYTMVVRDPTGRVVGEAELTIRQPSEGQEGLRVS